MSHDRSPATLHPLRSYLALAACVALVATTLQVAGVPRAATAQAAPAAACGGSATAFMLDNGIIRFGGGGQADTSYSTVDSIANNGMPKQPFYWSGAAARWYKLTYADIELSMTLGSGAGTNWTGSTVATGGNFDSGLLGLTSLSGRTVTASDWTQTRCVGTVSAGTGTLTVNGTATVNGQQVAIRHTYVLGAGDAFVSITTRITNDAGSALTNGHLWVGTRDDWVGISDGPTKRRGNLVDDAFAQISSASQTAAALQIETGTEGVLFYSTTPGANAVWDSCCQFSNAYGRDPATAAPASSASDGSYAMHLPLGDLAPGASKEIAWFYAAGTLADLGAVARAVSQAAAGASDIASRTADSGKIEFTSAVTGQVHAIAVPAGSTPPTAEQIRAGVAYGSPVVSPVFSTPIPGGLTATAGQAIDVTVSGLQALTTYDVYVVTAYLALVDGEEVPSLSEISDVTFTTRAPAPTIASITPSPGALTVAFTGPSGGGVTYQYSTDGGSTWTARSPASDASPIVITGLSDGTEYSVAIRAVVEGDLGMPSVAQSGTPTALPTVGITSVSSITMSSATVAATVTSTASVTARGFVHGPTSDPQLGGTGVTTTDLGTGAGAIGTTLTGLTPGATVYVRAYATNVAGTVYGPTQVFDAAANAIATTAAPIRWFAGPTAIDPGLTVEGADLDGATVSIENNRTGDILACPDLTGTGISCTYSTATGVLTLSGTATAATYRTVLRGVTFTTSNAGTDTTPRTVTFNLGGSLTFDPATGHYYEIVRVSATGPTYTGGTQDPGLTKGDLLAGGNISWEEARCRAKYLNGTFGGVLENLQMAGTTRVADRTTLANDRCVATAGTGTLTVRTLNGLAGHLANITSEAEHAFLSTKLTGTGWIGGSDIDVEGTWRWMDGPEAGQVFWLQSDGTLVRRTTNTIDGVAQFNYWSDGEPNNASGEHWAEFGFGGNGPLGNSWNDCRNGCGRTTYIVEYSAVPGVVPPVISASRTVTPLPAQSISFSLASTLTYGDPALPLVATSGAGAVSFAVTSGDGTACTIIAGTLTWVGPGTCTVTATQAGTDADGGVQPAPPVVRTITMTRRPLPIVGLVATPRAYDATTTVALTGTPTFDVSALVKGDDGGVTAGGAPVGTLPSPGAGDGRTVTVSGVTLSGPRAFAYEPAPTPLTVDIARREVRLSGTFTVADRPYDATTVVTAATQALSLRTDDIVLGDADDLALGIVTFAADDRDAGVRVARPVGATLSGARAADYLVVSDDAPSTTFRITPVVLTVGSGTFIVTDRVYDGTTDAAVVGHDLVLTGLVGGDSLADISWSPSARFTDRTAGTGRTVELVGGAVIGGARGGGYVLDVDGAPTATASIAPRPLTVTGATAATRVYDGTTAVSVSGAALVNTVAGDAVSLANATSGVAASRDAGTRPVTTAMTLVGADAGNYVLSAQPSLSVTITPRAATVTLGPVAPRVYDRTGQVPLSAAGFTIAGLVPGDAIVATGTALTPFRDVGTRVFTVDPTYVAGPGTSLANYTLPTSLTGTVTITPRPVTVVGLRALSRPWDGTTTAVLEGGRLEGVVPGDTVSLTGATFGTFAAATPGTHAVRADVALSGPSAGNYRLVPVPALSASIARAAATLRITGGLTQFADGRPRQVIATVTPVEAGRVVITYQDGGAPTAPGTYRVSVRLDSTTHEAAPLERTMTVSPIESLLFPGAPVPSGPSTGSTATPAGPSVGPGGSDRDPEVVAARTEQLLARLAVRDDGTRAFPEIGPVLESDGTAPALAPREERVLEDGEPSVARVIVVDDERLRVEKADGTFELELQAARDDGTRLPVSSDGTLLLDRDGLVNISGTGFLAGSTAEVWMFSDATFLGTAIVGPDGSFRGAFLVDELLEPGDHTLQLNGFATDGRVRSTSLGVRIADGPAVASRPEAEDRVWIITALTDTPLGGRGPVALLLLAAALSALITRWWIIGRRRSDDEAEDHLDRDALTLSR